MRHEKILKRADGSQVSIVVDLYIDSFKIEPDYKIRIATKAKGKRNWSHIDILDNYNYRSGNVYAKLEMEKQELAKHVSPEEILQAKTELWEKLKPA